MELRTCSKCGAEKSVEAFSFANKAKGRRRGECKTCEKAYKTANKQRLAALTKEWRKNNPDKVKRYDATKKERYGDKINALQKRYRATHKNEIKSRQAQYYQTHKDALLAKNAPRSKAWYAKNKDKVLVKMARRYQSNKENIHKKSTERRKLLYKTDQGFRIRMIVSRSVAGAIKRNGGQKTGSCLKHLPYPIAELKAHIEKQFEPWMNWDNQGRYLPQTWDDNDSSTWTWQIDHIIPQSTLLYTSMEDENFQKCWALSNLRPLSAKRNHSDGVNRTRH